MDLTISVQPAPEPTTGWNVFIGERCAIHVRPEYAFPTGELRGWKYYKAPKARGIPYCRMLVDEEAKAITNAAAYAQRWVDSGLMRER